MGNHGGDADLVTRRADPERIFQARRAAVRYALMDTGMNEATANRWCDAGELEAASEQLSRDAAYWEAGEAWIAVERERRIRLPYPEGAEQWSQEHTGVR